MSKSRDHIKRFLTGVIPVNCDSEQQIKLYLKNRKIKADIFYPDDKCVSAERISYDQFKHWLYSDMPHRGEIINFNESCGCTGIVVEEKWDSVIIGAVLIPGGTLSLNGYRLKDEPWRMSSFEEKRALQAALAKSGYDWNYVTGKLEKRLIPSNPQFVRLMVVGEQVGIGIFREINRAGELEMHCVKMNGARLDFSSPVNMGNADGFSIFKTFDEHRIQIQEELARNGYIWNPKCRRIEKNCARAKVGKNYFSITNTLDVKSYIEKNNSFDQKRFNRGNYFLCRAVAERVRDKMYNLCKEEMIAEDNV